MVTELFSLSGYFVKNLQIKKNKIYITVESGAFLFCPDSNQSFIGTVKDLSISGRRCF